MIHVGERRELLSTSEAVWAVVSDTRNEPRYWPGLKDMQILSERGSTIEREVNVQRGPLGSVKSTQRVEVDAVRKLVLLTMLNGPMFGTRSVAVRRLGPGRTLLEVEWKVEVQGIPKFAERFVRASLASSTKEALERISVAAAGRPITKAARGLL